MSTRLRDVLMRELGVLRHEPIEKRIRATLGGGTVIDSTRAMLVWEPQRVVPTYAVPEEDVRAEIASAAGGADVPAIGDAPQLAGRRVLDPSIPFSVRSTDGEPLVVRVDGREAAAFRAADPDLEGYVIVDFDGFDEWFEEDERNVGHPRDPFHRIDIVHASRHTRTYCAYKGQASYLSHGEAADVAWTYPAPLREAAEVTGRIAFFNERADLVVDGTRLERPITPWSKR
jgi:uncharacterized protein (DUF427 family)